MSAARKLEVFHQGELVKAVDLDQDVWVGRDEFCVIRLDDRAISRKHAIFRSTRDGVEVENKSKFGWIRVNGTDCPQALLKTGDRVELGAYEIRLQQTEEKIEALHDVVTQIENRTGTPDHSMSIEMAVHELPDEIEITNESNPIPIDEPQQKTEATSFIDVEAAEEIQENVDLQGQQEMSSDANPDLPEGVEILSSDPLASNSDGEVPIVTDPQTKIFSSDGATRVMEKPENLRTVLSFSSDGSGVEEYELGEKEVFIGRSQQCHIVLEDKRSSRKHTKIWKNNGQYFIQDLGSANGTLVNDALISTEQELVSGDRIQIGDTLLTFKAMQSNYEQLKNDLIAIPPQEAIEIAAPITPGLGFAMPTGSDLSANTPNSFGSPIDFSMSQPNIPSPQFEAPKEEKKSIIGKMLDRYRAMNTKQQIIYGLVVLGLVWMLTEDEPEEEVKPQVTSRMTKKKKDKDKGDKEKKDASENIGGLPLFEALTPEQQRYVEAQYSLGFDYYKNREYDKSIFEIEKIFRLVQDYKQAREIHSYAIEGKRQLEAREEDKKKKEAERQAQLRLQALIDQASVLMEKKKYREAEALFPEIELMQPENLTVAEWRKMIASEAERIEQERAEKKRLADIKAKNWGDYEVAAAPLKRKAYYEAIDNLEELEDREMDDTVLKTKIRSDIEGAYRAIANLRDPHMKAAKSFEEAGQYAEAHKEYELALKGDPEADEAVEAMQRIRTILNDRAKAPYVEGVFAESFNDFETAEKKYREVLDLAPKDSDYYKKATSRMNKLTVFRRPASLSESADANNTNEGSVE
jgi:pSer/pThr/pTyr-binding forkhead associated (FHA) protein/tetratricopeptide (TPR) repeat protein